MNNGKTKWLLWLAGGILTIVIAVLSFMGNAIYANEDKRVEANTKIIAKIHDEDGKIRAEIKHDLIEIRTEQKVMTEKLNKNHTEILVAIAELKK